MAEVLAAPSLQAESFGVCRWVGVDSESGSKPGSRWQAASTVVAIRAQTQSKPRDKVMGPGSTTKTDSG